MDLDVIAADVAAAVGLAEGAAGVRDVLRAVAWHEPAAARDLSRVTELPVPIVTAVCGELRKRGLVDRSRPARLTPEARDQIARTAPHLSAACPACGGLGLAIPPELAGLADRLAPAATGAPPARMELDQAHCTVATKLRRVLRMHQAGALDGTSVLLLGDDDLIAVALAWFQREIGGAIRRLTVIDADPAVLAWIADQAAGSGLAVETVEHDLRQPLPQALAGQFDVACTDPPYTVGGAELFLSRAVAALAELPGRQVYFSFGARRPEEALATQEIIASLGLTIRSLTPNFNEYTGAGILAGTSHLYQLRTTGQTIRPGQTPHQGPLYTADTRPVAIRPYRCAGCGAVHEVGPGGAFAQIAELRLAGCPACGGTTFRPLPRGGGPLDPAGRPNANS